MPRITRFLAIAATALALVFPTTGSAQTDAGPSVSVQDFQFNPVNAQVPAGATVTWTFDGASAHTVTADDASFDSGTMNQGGTFTMTFDTPGTYAYYCAIHGAAGGVGMAGTIVVSG
jgi:plastocyanin